MIWFPFSKTSEMKAGVALDVGSKSVGGAIFTADSAGKPKLLYVTREKVVFQKTLTGENLSAAMFKALGLVLFHLEKYGVNHLCQGKQKYHVTHVNVTVSSPWHASETKTIKLKFDNPSLITDKVVEDLLVKEEKSFEEQFGGENGNSSALEVLEHKIIEIRLNGYPTAKPYGKKAEELEFRIFDSIILSNTLKTLKKLIGKRFPESHCEFHTFTVAAFASIRDLFPKMDSFLVVQVGGEVSDVTIVKKGIILETKTFPVGHNSLLRALGKICRNHPECTLEGLLKLHQEVRIQTADQKKVESVISEVRISWLSHFNTAISNFSEETFLPKTIFLFEENPYASLFASFLKEAESSQFTDTAEPFNVNIVDSAITSSFAESDKSILPDEILSMEAGFTAKLRH